MTGKDSKRKIDQLHLVCYTKKKKCENAMQKYISKHNAKHKKQIILLMISNGDVLAISR